MNATQTKARLRKHYRLPPGLSFLALTNVCLLASVRTAEAAGPPLN
jgi:hypothetical protein